LPVCDPAFCCPVYSPLGYGGFGYPPVIAQTTIVDPYIGGGFVGAPIIGGGVTEVYNTGYVGGGATVYETGYV
jgi:hypothetical protein